MYTFTDKVVLVTGSASGIGKAIANEYAKLGAKIVLNNLVETPDVLEFAEELKRQGTDVSFVAADVSKRDAVHKMKEHIEKTYGKLDILVNNVGASLIKKPFAEISDEEWDLHSDVNLKSVYLVTQEMLPLLKLSENSSIVNLCSSVIRNGGIIGGSAYTAAKGGVDALTRALAKELAADNIRVNGVSPGLVDSNFHAVNVEERYPHLIQEIPLKRVGKPEDLAGAVLFFTSSYASYITGEVLEVGGGARLK
ncbi:SDR family NAD(P)-dependent oxidoreductase [Sporosarcina sp. GW1-11]|uniref:SDR family NAD(P)-dependent oxidoreductase n=1 Tax=Sporosarcina sp. GW1-11 TaxID=2899126 RepID=UPI00294F7904|nr:SDR family NAD(P)-dependent oxidoreductase [Sporosarcina sp. GW1-11]MDV6377440.1 SDR family NAD(P)-dependent oxidoreductase [Sporosarcina sp. GW1-11]